MLKSGLKHLRNALIKRRANTSIFDYGNEKKVDRVICLFLYVLFRRKYFR